jgi:hypothetical protein
MVDRVEVHLPVQIARVAQCHALPEEIVGALPFGFDRLFEWPGSHLRENPIDGVNVRVVSTGAYDRVAVGWRDEYPNFVTEPLSLGDPIPGYPMVRPRVWRTGIGGDQELHSMFLIDSMQGRLLEQLQEDFLCYRRP